MIETIVTLFVVGFLLVWHEAVFSFLFAVWVATKTSHPILWVLAHPGKLILYITGYLIIGGVWSVVKWYLIERKRVRDAKQTYGDKWQKVKTDLSKSYNQGDYEIWIAFWPFSIVTAIYDDLLREIVESIVDELKRVYQRVTDWVWR